MAATDLGKVGIVMKGTWSSSAAYEVLDAVSYNEGLYIAKQNVPENTVPTNTTYWQEALNQIHGTLGCVPGTFSELTDLNDMQIGTFLSAGFSDWENISNVPTSSWAGIVYCIQGYANTAVQIAEHYSNFTIYIRRQASGGWSTWKQMVLS